MKREIKTFEVTCDKCRKVEYMTTSHSAGSHLPHGWATVTTQRDGDSYGYDSDELCPECHSKRMELTKSKLT